VSDASSPSPVRARPGSAGFTLIELLVATAVFALIAFALVAAMSSVGSTQARVDERIAADEDLRSSERFLRGTLGRISPRQSTPTADGPGRLAFRGEPTAAEWIGVMPARHGAGGLYRFRLFLRPASGGEPSALVLQFAPLSDRNAPLDSGPLDERVMVRDVDEVTFRYLDAEDGEPQWRPAWEERQYLPERIGMSLHSASFRWPELVVAVIAGPGVQASRRPGRTSPIMVGP